MVVTLALDGENASTLIVTLGLTEESGGRRFGDERESDEQTEEHVTSHADRLMAPKLMLPDKVQVEIWPDAGHASTTLGSSVDSAPPQDWSRRRAHLPVAATTPPISKPRNPIWVTG